MDFKFRVLRGQNLGDEFQFLFIDGLLLVGTVQQARRWQLITARNFRKGRFRLVLGIGAVRDFDFDSRRGLRSLWQRCEGGGLFFRHAFDAGACEAGVRGSGRFVAGGILTRGFVMVTRRTRWHELCRYVRPLGAALVELLLLALPLALLLPVLKAISERQHEGKAGWRPDLKRRERESGGEVERNRQNGSADNVCASNVKVPD